MILFVSALWSCQGSRPVDTATTISTFINIEHKWSVLKIAWIDADITLISKSCASLTPTVRRRLANSGNADALFSFDNRKKSCEATSDWRDSLSELQKQASEAVDGEALEKVQAALVELREKTDLAVQEFPTSTFAEGKFPFAASTNYRAKHEATATEGGELAAQAVGLSREASGAAMKTASSSDHELDKSRARLADEAYTKSSSQLASLASYTAASEIVTHVDDILSTVDGAIGSAQRTGETNGNPAIVARETLPSAVPSATPTPKPPIETSTATLAKPMNVSKVLDSPYRLLVETTSQLSVVSSSQFCEDAHGLEIRFKDDGSGGCAILGQGSHAVLNSGSEIDLIPVTNSEKGNMFALLYADTKSGSKFVGILPGNGTGSLDVHVEDGVIIERNGSSVKRSTYQNGKVVEI